MRLWVLAFLALVLFFAYFLSPAYSGALVASPPKIVVPVFIHIVQDTSPEEYYTSQREAADILAIIAEANRIWSQADIEFDVIGVEVTTLDVSVVPATLRGDSSGLVPFTQEAGIHIFFVRSLNNVNGFASVDERSVLLADRTTAPPGRTLAHELGHILGLYHPDSEEPLSALELMARGEEGDYIPTEDKALAREQAQFILEILAQ